MNILVTIAARGGSKGVPNKNIRPLLGKPLIAHSIEQALVWGRAAKVIVSTDSEAIAAVARTHGAELPFIRPATLATDTAAKLGVLRHALEQCERIYNARFDIVVDLDATAPMRTVADLEKCYQLFMEKRPTTLFSVVQAQKNPYFNMVEIDTYGYATLSKQLSSGAVGRRQDAPAVYAMNASIYFYESDFLRSTDATSCITNRSLIYEMEPWTGFDIDREVDFLIVEQLFARYCV